MVVEARNQRRFRNTSAVREIHTLVVVKTRNSGDLQILMSQDSVHIGGGGEMMQSEEI